MNAEKICIAIRTLRIRKNMTQTQLAEMLGVTDKAVSKWERGLGTPDISVVNRLAQILDIDTDNLLEGNIVYLENKWVGVLDVNHFDSSISVTTEIYGKPIVYILLCYFALVGIREVYVQCAREKEKLQNVVGTGVKYGMNIHYNSEPPKVSNKMVVDDLIFIYGPNLTKYFQRAMSHKNVAATLIAPKSRGEGESIYLNGKNQVSDARTRDQKYYKLPISFIPCNCKGYEYEPMGRGMIVFELKDIDDVVDAAALMKIIGRSIGEEVYCLEEIASRRGMINKLDLTENG